MDYIKNNSEIDNDFVEYFYDILKYPKNVFVINFNEIYKLFDFNRRHLKTKFIKCNFIENTDYLISKINNDNLEMLYLTVDCFKRFCIKIDSNDIYFKFCELENLYTKLLIYEKDVELNQLKYDIREDVLVEAFQNKKVMYIGLVDYNIAKFGYTDNISVRIKAHKNDYSYFKLVYIVEHQNNKELEALFANYSEIAIRRKQITFYANKERKELVPLSTNFGVKEMYNILYELSNKIIVNNENDLELKRMEYEDRQNQREFELKKLSFNDN